MPDLTVALINSDGTMIFIIIMVALLHFRSPKCGDYFHKLIHLHSLLKIHEAQKESGSLLEQVKCQIQ